MIALIAIPHQTPARIHWYEDANTIIEAGQEAAEQADHDLPEVHGFDDPVRNAAHELADDWSSYLLVQSAEDIQSVRYYSKSDGIPGNRRHKANEVAALLPELEEEFSE